MGMLNLLQCLHVGGAYILSMFLLPHLLFQKHLSGRGLSYRFLFSLVTGNFFIVQMVLLLCLMRINHPVTVILSTYGVAIAVYCCTHKNEVRYFFKNQIRRIHRLAGGSYGLKLYIRDSLKVSWRFQRIRIWTRRNVLENWPRWVLLLAISAVAVWYFSYQTFTYYGFGAPDLSVHEKWLNAMGERRTFAYGVYPHGFHSIGYFLYAVFGVQFYNFLRFFGIFESLFLLWGLYLLMARLCKSRYAPFIGLGIFVMINGLNEQSFFRYSWPLPQEYGMMLIYPAVLFLWAYLQKRSRWDLILFGMAFSLTLSGHFYSTMIAGLFCGAVGLVFLWRMIKKRMLLPILLCGVLSVGVSLFPLGVAFAMGTPIEQSLTWALSVMKTPQTTTPVQPVETPPPSEEGGTVGQEGEEAPVEKIDLVRQLFNRFEVVYQMVRVNAIPGAALRYAYFLFLGLLFLYCFFSIFRSRKDPLVPLRVSMGLYQVFLICLLAAVPLGLPKLMDVFRTALFLVYAIPCVFSLGVDMVAELFGQHKGLARSCVALGASAVICAYSSVGEVDLRPLIRPLPLTYFMQYNEAYMAFQNIAKSFPKQKWTIVSPADETQLVWGQGWHYETLKFLEGQTEDKLTIPTEYVFFFVEKKPLVHGQVLYMNAPEILCTDISEELANMPLTPVEPESEYYKTQRGIVMAKMYAYLQEFEACYPDELQVYSETDAFVCYMLKQNEYHLYNFAFGKDPFK